MSIKISSGGIAAPAPVRVSSLQPGDVVHIGPHTVHGHQVACGEANVAVQGIHWGDAGHHEVVLDYGPHVEFPGRAAHRGGSVVYGRLDQVDLVYPVTGSRDERIRADAAVILAATRLTASLGLGVL